MKRHRLIGLTAILMITSSLWCGLGAKTASAATIQFYDNQLTSYTSDQVNPDIYEYGLNNYAVVWQDNRNGNWDIYMYYQKYLGNSNWETQWDTRITSNSSNNVNPKIYDDTIVYQSNRNGNWDIYMYNLISKVETQITNNAFNQQFPEVYGNIIVWQDYRNSKTDYFGYVTGLDIYIYDLTTQTEQRLPSTEQNSLNPAISGSNVVYAAENYEKMREDTLVSQYICSYDLSSGLKTIVAATETWRNLPGLDSGMLPGLDTPAVDGNLVAWFNDNSNVIGAKNVSSGSTWQSPNAWHQNPDVSGRFVVFQTYYGGNWHINLYDSSSVSLSQATTSTPGHQQNPAISTKYAYFIVYQDDRSGRWHIYIAPFDYSAGLLGSSNPLTGSNPQTASITPSANATTSGNQDLTIIALVAIVAVAAIGTAVFAVTRRRKPKKQEL